MAAPAVSVVIPAFNAERFVAAALDSVLAQTLADREILVVDDGSTDDTLGVLAKYADVITLDSQPNRGVARARNRALEMCRGRYVAFLDADDIWLPHKLATQLAMLTEDPGCAVVCSPFVEVDADLKTRATVQAGGWEGPLLRSLLLHGNVIGTPSSVVVERSLLAAVGGFEPSLSQCADWDLWLRLATRTRFLRADHPLVWYRRHEAAMSRDISLLERDSVNVLDRAFSRDDLPPAWRSLRRRSYGRNFMVLAGSYFHAGQVKDSLRCALRALWLDPRLARQLASFPLRACARRKA